jgi:hypothetical protein
MATVQPNPRHLPEPTGPVPEENLPGHHPEVEQDKPTGPPPTPHQLPRRFEFAFDPWFRVPALLVGVRPSTASVEVDDTAVAIHFGPWQVLLDRSNVLGVRRTGPYQPWKVIGPPHLSLRDRGLTFATNRDAGVCLRLREPVPGIEPTGRLRHPGITVTVAAPDELVGLLGGGPG